MRTTRFGIAVLLVMALAMLVACGAGDDDDDDAGDGAGNLGVGAEEPADGESRGDDDAGVAATPGVPDSSGAQGSLIDRKIIFTAELELEAEDVRSAFDRASLIARQAGGYVEQSSLSSREGDNGELRDFASLTMRVPVTQYDGVLSNLRTLTDVAVLREGSSSTEVTEEYTDLESRIRNLERTEAQYLILLERAETIDEILTVNDRLDGVRSQIEQIQGRLNLLDDLTELATISVGISPIIPGVQVESGGEKSFVEVFSGGMEWSADVLGRLFAGSALVLIAAMWLAVPGAVLLIVLRISRRRQVSNEASSAS